MFVFESERVVECKERKKLASLYIVKGTEALQIELALLTVIN